MKAANRNRIKRGGTGHARMTSKGREIVASLREAVDTERNGIPVASRFTVRSVDLPDAPNAYSSVDVQATRNKIGVSQAIFAHLLGVSVMLVRAWEQGQRRPAAWACRLLDEMNRNPRHWRGMLRDAS